MGEPILQLEMNGTDDGYHPLAGCSDISRKLRRTIYCTLLEFLRPQDKIYQIMKLCSSVIVPITDENFSLDNKIDEIFYDTIWILTSDNSCIKLSHKMKNDSDGIEVQKEAILDTRERKTQRASSL